MKSILIVCYTIVGDEKMNRIKILREENHITQEELAEKLTLSKGIISLYEKEERKPSLEVLVKLSEIFDCSIDYILCKSDIRNPEKGVDFDPDKLRIGLSKKDYENITDEQMKQIEELAKVILKDNLKDKDKDKK